MSNATVRPSEFLRLFFADDERIPFRAFPPKGIPGTAKKEYGSIAALRNGAGLREQLERLNQDRGVYFVVNFGGDSDKDITRYNACFAEDDKSTIPEQHAKLDAAPLPTTARVETPRSVHAYWKLKGNVDPSAWHDAQERLISFFRGDPAIKNPSRVMRVPGFDHIGKDGKTRTPVNVVQFDPERAYSIAELLAAFPVVKQKPERRAKTAATSGRYATWDALRAELGRRIMAHETARQNHAGNWDCRGICHDGEGNTGLFYNTSTNQAHCNSHCEQSVILRAFGLPEAPERPTTGHVAGQPAGSRTKPTNDPGEEKTPPVVEDIEIEERAAIQEQEPRESFIDFAPAFLSVEDPPLEYIIPEIMPVGALVLDHGDPRTMKSLALLEKCVAAATATPAFGLERFRPTRKYRVLYCSQEDHASIVRPRVKKLLRTRGIETWPETLAFAVYKGIDFDSELWRARFFDEIVDLGFELVAIDPVRGFTAFADTGPKDVIPIAKFLRKFTARAITVNLAHHDTKPPANGQDTRRRSHRASGGAWFSVSECPISFEKITDSQSLVSPEDYKFSADPRPFTITYHEDENGIRLIGEDSTAQEAQTLAIDEKVLEYLAEHPGASGSKIVQGVRKQKDCVLESLNRLFNSDKVDYVDGPRRAKLWTIRAVRNYSNAGTTRSD